LAFVEAGLMVAMPRDGAFQHYSRLDDPFWQTIVHLTDSWLTQAKSSSRTRSTRNS
jgi:hypothetical protein